MRGAERVVDALGALGETGKTAALAQRAHAGAPAGEDLVRIGLMADIPDQPVMRRVEHVVKGGVSSTTPSPAPRCPPVTETASIVSCRNSSASWRSWLGSSWRRWAGVLIRSRSGVLLAVVTILLLDSAQYVAQVTLRSSETWQSPRPFRHSAAKIGKLYRNSAGKS